MPDIPNAPSSYAGLAAALADRYTIERELGRGGNAVVYLAHDRKHDRQVALKVLSPDLPVGSERFLREIGIAAKLTHPHILPLYDSGEAQGFLYYVMPYVPGDSLRERLQRERQVPIADALRLTQDVAEALSYAHAEGVVHRDIKPENILLSPGGAVVADFGIARALSAAGGATATEGTIAVGTPAYMSPEQGSGGAVDARSDVYSLGCVLYEMLAGRPPYTGQTAQEILARHALDPIPSLRAARPGVPRAVERAVAKALAKVPADRFASAAEFAEALAAQRRRVPAYVAVALGLLVVGGLVARQTLLRAPERSVAVLPFVNLSGDTTQEYFSDGVTEELINALTHVQSLRVPARTSSFAFKGKTTDIREIGRRLNVATVLEGSVRRLGNRLRVSAQLIKVADGYHLWSETYDRDVRDVFAVQEDISRTIVGALRVTLAPGESTALVPRQPGNLEAYDLYLRGRYFFARRGREDIARAIDNFRRAIALDSGYAATYSGLADAYIIDGNFNYAPGAEVYPKADSAARKALALDASLAEAHTSLARLRQEKDADWQGAEPEYRRAIVLNPRYALAHSWFGLGLSSAMARGDIQNRWDEAIREGKEGQRLDPLSPAMSNNLGAILERARRPEEAMEYFRGAAELQPDWDLPRSNLLRAYLAARRFKAGLDEYQRLGGLRALAGRPGGLAAVGQMYALSGNRAEALRMLDHLLGMPRTPPVLQSLPGLYGALGEQDQAFAALEQARQGGVPLGALRSNPDLDPLRSDPRFAEFLKKLGREP